MIITESCGLKNNNDVKPWLVLLATGTKSKLNEVVGEFSIELNGFLTTIDLNILPLGLYAALIGMDWLERQRAKVDYYANIVECCNEEGEIIEVKGVPQLVSIRKISAL